MDSAVNSAECGVEIPDSVLDAGGTEPIDVVALARAQGFGFFRPRSIVFDRNGSDADSGVAQIRGILWDDQTKRHTKARTRTLGVAQQHPRAYRYIIPHGTTARGIEINA